MLLLPLQGMTKPAKTRKPSSTANSSGPAYRADPRAMALADEIATQHQLDKAWVRQQLGTAKKNKQVIQFVKPPKQGFVKNWGVYRSRFIDSSRIDAGVRFWAENSHWLDKASASFGVPPWLVVGIVGVETIYGRDTGRFLVLDALTTLALDFPAEHPKAEQRQAYFRAELAQFLSLAAQGVLDTKSTRGSYAGAMGWPQFMPSSWRRQALDFDGDGKIDLFNSQADVIGSVANYFRHYGWQKDQPTHFRMTLEPNISPENKQVLLAPDIVPTFSAQELLTRQASPEESAKSFPEKLAVVELLNGEDAPSYVAGTQNFFVITRYNWSAYYAMAVIELGQAVAQAREKQAKGPSTAQ